MKAKLLSFHGQQSIKDEYISRIKLHAAADEIIKGTYWQNGKGCAVGCTVHTDNHLAYETELGIPFDLAIYEDKIFESLPNDKAKTFPLEFLESISVGVNLERVGLNFSLWLVTDEKEGLLSNTTHAPAVEFLNNLAEILKKEITDTATKDDRKGFKAYAYAHAYASASASAYAHAYAYAYASAHTSAYASAYAYASAHTSAYAYASAHASAYAYASASAHASASRNKLIQLLKEAK